MAGCCAPSEYGKVFGNGTARADARRYRKRGLSGTAEQLAGWLRPLAAGATVLEVGGGVGAVQLELLAAGAVRATNVELSPEYEEAAAELAEEAGVAERVERIVGDYVTAGDVGRADLVVLHRVVCCYPDGRAMVARSAAAARSTLAITYPRSTWWVRAASRLGNAILRLGRRSFRVYIHDPEMLISVAADRGLTQVARTQGLVWESLLWRRP